VSRSKTTAKLNRDRARALPWAVLLQAAMVIGRRWRALSEKDRARIARLLRDSGGRPRNLRPKERRELRKLARKLDLKGMGRELVGLAGARRGRRGRRRRAS
jgi:hypothetical protein